VFANLGFRFVPKAETASLTSFTPFFRVRQRSSCLPLAPVSRDASSAPPVESLAPSVFPHMEQRLFPGSDLPAGALAPPGFLNLLTLSSAPCLPALLHAGSTLGVSPSRALLLRCSRTLSPTPLPSCRCDALASTPSPTDLPISRRPVGSVCSCSSAPRLQGFAPHQSLPLRTGGLDRSERMALLGFSVLQGSLPLRHDRAFARSPLTSSLASTSDRHNRNCTASISTPAPQGFRSRRDWLGLSCDTAETASPSSPADPLELPAPFDHPSELETATGPGVASSSIGVHRCPLTCSL
jgi:hypothetical protein